MIKKLLIKHNDMKDFQKLKEKQLKMKYCGFMTYIFVNFNFHGFCGGKMFKEIFFSTIATVSLYKTVNFYHAFSRILLFTMSM